MNNSESDLRTPLCFMYEKPGDMKDLKVILILKKKVKTYVVRLRHSKRNKGYKKSWKSLKNIYF